MAYKINQPAHLGGGKPYEVIVEGDVLYIQDGNTAVEVGPKQFVLPYKKAPAGTTRTVNVFSIPYRCDMSEPQISVQFTAQSGSMSLGGPKQLVVHDAT